MMTFDFGWEGGRPLAAAAVVELVFAGVLTYNHVRMILTRIPLPPPEGAALPAGLKAGLFSTRLTSIWSFGSRLS